MEQIRFFLGRRVFLKRRIQIYAQMAFALEHDANIKAEIHEMLRVAAMRGSALEPVYLRWEHNYEHKAGKLSAAMRGTVSDSEVGLIASAEETRHLVPAFYFLSKAVKQINAMQESISKAIRAVILPALLLVGLFYGIDSGFFPNIEESLPRREWGMLPRAVATFCHHISLFLLIATLIAVPGFYFWVRSLPKWTGTTRRYLEKTIFYGKYRDQQCGMFLMNLAFLMQAELPLRASLEKMLVHATPYIRSHLRVMLKKLDKDATNAGVALVSTGLFNEELGDLLTNYARWSNWHTQIGEIASNAMEIVTKDIVDLSPRIEDALKITIGFVLFIVISTVGLIIMAMLRKVGFK